MHRRIEATLKRYAQRQGASAWGKDYQPAIRATPQEAPRMSRPTILQSGKFERELHLLSTPETHFALLALFHPALFELHEQKVLSPIAAAHPLQGHAKALGLSLPAVLGTVAAADQLGALSSHPKVLLVIEEAPMWVPVPLVGDLLLYLVDAAGPYCVNWTIKLTHADFRRRLAHRAGKVRDPKPDPKAELRHEIESLHYAAAAVRTQRLAGSDMNPELVANLRTLFGWHARPSLASTVQREQAIELFRAGIGGAEKVYVLAQRAAAALNLPTYEVLVIFYQAVWHRMLAVDLFYPLLPDRRLRAQREDPLRRYAAWFAR